MRKIVKPRIKVAVKPVGNGIRISSTINDGRTTKVNTKTIRPR